MNTFFIEENEKLNDKKDYEVKMRGIFHRLEKLNLQDSYDKVKRQIIEIKKKFDALNEPQVPELNDGY